MNVNSAAVATKNSPICRIVCILKYAVQMYLHSSDINTWFLVNEQNSKQNSYYVWTSSQRSKLLGLIRYIAASGRSPVIANIGKYFQSNIICENYSAMTSHPCSARQANRGYVGVLPLGREIGLHTLPSHVETANAVHSMKHRWHHSCEAAHLLSN